MKWTLTIALTAVLTLAAASVFAQENPDDSNNANHPDAPSSVVIGGADRYETAAAIALSSFPGTSSPVIYIANGENPIDALAVGVTNERPLKLLLVTRDTVPPATRDALQQIAAVKVVFLGGDAAISPEVRDEVLTHVKSWD